MGLCFCSAEEGERGGGALSQRGESGSPVGAAAVGAVGVVEKW